MSKTSYKLFAILIALIACFSFAACNDGSTPTVDYSADNAYTVVTSDTDVALSFAPQGAEATRGLIFYVGTVIAPKHYTYLGEALAKQGYLVVIPKVDLNMAYLDYREEEVAFANYPNVKFFVGGHSQGGGAALKRAQQQADTALGLIVYSPLCYEQDTIADTSIPTLLIEASEDHVLTAAMKADSKTRLPQNYEHLMIEGGCHMSFCTYDSDEVLAPFNDGPLKDITREEQRAQALQKTLQFMKSVVTA